MQQLDCRLKNLVCSGTLGTLHLRLPSSVLNCTLMVCLYDKRFRCGAFFIHIYSTSGAPAIAPPVDTLQDVHGLEGAFINKIDLPGQVTQRTKGVLSISKISTISIVPLPPHP